MEPFTLVTSRIVPLPLANVDTDAIIPKQYLKSIKRSGYGVNLFDSWRYLDPGDLETDHSKRRINPDFVLNNSQYEGGKILVAFENFGCGSSREHAVWALLDYGIRVVIAPSFGDIFFQNSLKNGLLPVRVGRSSVEEIINFRGEATVDLVEQKVSYQQSFTLFEIDAEHKDNLLSGKDEIARTLEHRDAISLFENKHLSRFPWI